MSCCLGSLEKFPDCSCQSVLVTDQTNSQQFKIELSCPKLNSTISNMALRGFSSFEKMFRAKMAQTAPINVLTAKKKNDGLTQQELADYRRVFNKGRAHLIRLLPSFRRILKKDPRKDQKHIKNALPFIG